MIKNALGSAEFLNLMRKGSRPEFNLFLGEVLASAVTSFVQVPSSEVGDLSGVWDLKAYKLLQPWHPLIFSRYKDIYFTGGL